MFEFRNKLVPLVAQEDDLSWVEETLRLAHGKGLSLGQVHGPEPLHLGIRQDLESELTRIPVGSVNVEYRFPLVLVSTGPAVSLDRQHGQASLL